jgi:hypothetical protein
MPRLLHIGIRPSWQPNTFEQIAADYSEYPRRGQGELFMNEAATAAVLLLL